jgi:hypothetical protein
MGVGITIVGAQSGLMSHPTGAMSQISFTTLYGHPNIP